MRLMLTHCVIVVLLMLIAAQCGAYYKERSEKIAATTEMLLQTQDFEKLYEGLDEVARSLTPKPEFLERAEQLVSFMKEADSELRFVKSREGGVYPDSLSDIYFEHRTLGAGATQIDVDIWIDLNGPVPKLFDVCARPSTDETVEAEHCLTNALRKI